MARAIHRRAGASALALALVFSFAGIFQHGLWTPDEPREAEVGREMLVRDWSALPTLGGRPFLEKPPLFPWAMAAGFALFGVDDGVARIPAAVASAIALLVAYRLGRRVGGRLVGLLAVVVLATCAEFWWMSHRAINDTALTAFVAAGHLVFFEEWLLPPRRGRALRFTLFALSVGLAFLTKGVIGPVLIAGPPLLALAMMRDWTLLRAATGWAGAGALAGGAALGLPWMAALARTPGGFENVRECVVNQVVARSTGASADFAVHAQPPWYYVRDAAFLLAPWTLAVPAILLGGTRRRGPFARRLHFVAWLAASGLLLLSIPSGKRDLYLLPLLPATSVVFAAWLARARATSAADRRTAAGILLVVALGSGLLAIGGTLLRFRLAAAFAQPAVRLLVRSGSVALALTLLSFAALAISSGSAAVALLRRRTLSPGGIGSCGARVALSVAALALVGHLLVRPLIDPIRNMRVGALAVSAMVPASEPLFALEPDETTRAVLPFYSGRLVTSVRMVDLPALLDAGSVQHLVVMDKSVGRIADSVLDGLEIVATVDLSSTRQVSVYRNRRLRG